MENPTDLRQPESSTTSNVLHNDQDQPSLKEKWWRNLKTLADHLFKMDKEEWLKDMRGNLSMVAALISAITFQAAVNPPGGVVQTSTNTSRTLFGCSDAHRVTDDATRKRSWNLCTGEAVLAAVYQTDYLKFIKFNTFSFVAALSAALLLISGMPLRNRFLMWFLSIAMSASLTFLAMTYLEAGLMVTPDPIWGDTKRNFKKLMWILDWIASVKQFVHHHPFSCLVCEKMLST
ncbi:hypothetical protein L6164_031601 [Bauhinia variegata]|uniref:Uncharacterized protein n=1 Tax=Bauhinia variegata TaxID=167791 RepID=A0ACB9LGA1_BAUVA|nr:hypothetical protein L6164_031601 [Bauhinia variegata]